jgi:NADPH:quinone reductase-like Zn-dependent oxidoreductase
MESAACLGVAALTAGMTLWKWLEIPLPSTINSSDSEGDWLLIWGGSTVTGQFATQLACLSGWKVITVNSSLTKSLSESLGAAHVVVRDGKSESELLEEIQTVTNGGITRAIDLVSPKTAAIGLQAVSQGKPAHFAPLALMASSQVVPENVTAHTVEIKQFVLNRDNKFYAEEINRIIATGKLIIPEIVSLDGGLEGVPAGLDTLKKGNMGGKKLVSRIR